MRSLHDDPMVLHTRRAAAAAAAAAAVGQSLVAVAASDAPAAAAVNIARDALDPRALSPKLRPALSRTGPPAPRTAHRAFDQHPGEFRQQAAVQTRHLPTPPHHWE